jgi:hypothetical protein
MHLIPLDYFYPTLFNQLLESRRHQTFEDAIVAGDALKDAYADLQQADGETVRSAVKRLVSFRCMPYDLPKLGCGLFFPHVFSHGHLKFISTGKILRCRENSEALVSRSDRDESSEKKLLLVPRGF